MDSPLERCEHGGPERDRNSPAPALVGDYKRNDLTVLFSGILSFQSVAPVLPAVSITPASPLVALVVVVIFMLPMPMPATVLILTIFPVSFHIDPLFSFNVVGAAFFQINVHPGRGRQVTIDMDIYPGRCRQPRRCRKSGKPGKSGRRRESGR